jgi:hypothetical protein
MSSQSESSSSEVDYDSLSPAELVALLKQAKAEKQELTDAGSLLALDFQKIRAIADAHPEYAVTLKDVGMRQGWKFVGRALTGWTLEDLQKEKRLADAKREGRHVFVDAADFNARETARARQK